MSFWVSSIRSVVSDSDFLSSYLLPGNLFLKLCHICCVMLSHLFNGVLASRSIETAFGMFLSSIAASCFCIQGNSWMPIVMLARMLQPRASDESAMSDPTATYCERSTKVCLFIWFGDSVRAVLPRHRLYHCCTSLIRLVAAALGRLRRCDNQLQTLPCIKSFNSSFAGPLCPSNDTVVVVVVSEYGWGQTFIWPGASLLYECIEVTEILISGLLVLCNIITQYWD